MAWKIADRSAEMLYQTGEFTFKMKLDNGVEVDVHVDEIEIVADIHLEEVIEYVERAA